jgi:LuxR family transcriptional regulator, maltose regulon positive regulatory protein
VEPIDVRVFDALASPGSSVPGSVVPRLGSAFWSMSTPVALVLDDVHVLHNSECRAALSVLADHVPAGSGLALAGRAEPPLRVARLRAEGKILEIGPGDLALTVSEASLLLRNADVALGEDGHRPRGGARPGRVRRPRCGDGARLRHRSRARRTGVTDRSRAAISAQPREG